MIQLNFLDLIILAVIIYQGYKGYKSGLIMTFAPLVYWFMAFFLSVHFMGVGGQKFADYLGVSQRVGSVISFIVLITLCMIAVRWVIGFIDGIIGKGVVLGTSNRLMGSLLGGLKGFLLLSMIFLLLKPIKIPEQKIQDTSFFYSSVEGFVHKSWKVVQFFLPQAQSLSDKFQQSVNQELRR